MTQPYVNLTSAAAWVCLDCGAKNYTDLIPVENPEKATQIKAELDISAENDIYAVPAQVQCSSCDAEFRTAEDGPEGDPLETLISALEALEEADGEDDIALPIGTIVDNAGFFAEMLRDLAERLDEEG